MKSKLAQIFLFSFVLFSCNNNKTTQHKIPTEIGDSLSFDLGRRISNVPYNALFQDEGWFTWGGSMVKGDDDRFYLFYSRWPYENEMKGWLISSEIACAVADSPTGPYEFHSEVIKGLGGDSFDANMVHNPHIHKYDGKYYLYYIGATDKDDWEATRRTQRIGVAVADSINGPWLRSGSPLLDVSPGSFDSGFTTNPSVVKKNDSSYVVSP